MAAQRARARGTQRVTNVDPWILGGEGRLVDLFPMNPGFILLCRFLLSCLKHPIRASLVALTIYLVFFTNDPDTTDIYEIHWFYLLIPIIFYLIYACIHTLKHWYYSPDVPFIRSKSNHQN